MRKTKMTKIIALLLCVICLASCTAPAGPITDPVTDPVTEPVSNEGKIMLVDKGEGKVVLVRADRSSAGVSAALATLRNYIKLKTGVRVDAASDLDMPERAQLEIVIGYTNRLYAEAANLRKGMYQIRADIEEDGKQVVYLLGYDESLVEAAVDHFIAYCTKTDGESLWVDEKIRASRMLELNDYEIAGAQIISNTRSFNVTERSINKSSSLSRVSNIHAITMLTGELSINATKTRYNICGTDLGIPVYHNGKLWFFFGDTFSGGDMKGDWRSNTAAYTTDLDYTDGIVFDGMYSTVSTGYASELVAGLKKTYTEVTKIPTGAISLDGTLYFYFMSVNNWDNATWECNYGGLVKSTDDGKTWTVVKDVQWPGDTKFCQNAPVLNEADGKVYIVGITGGRKNPARMMRVDKDKIEDINAYEYLTGYDADGNAIWTAGEEGMRSEYYIINDEVAENCIVYNPYLEEWMIIYKKGANLVIYTAKNAGGPYKETVNVVIPSIGSGLYGGFTCPALWQENGRKMVLTMSTWDPCYNVFLLEMTLEKSK